MCFLSLNHIFPFLNSLLEVKKVTDSAWVIRREWFCCSSYLVQKNLWRTNVLNTRWGFRDREGLFSRGLWVLQIHHECSGRRIFRPWVGGLVQGHIAMDAFSEECFPCLSPTTVLVVFSEAKLHILFTPRKRRKNEEIEAHSLHTSSLLDADLSLLAGR